MSRPTDYCQEVVSSICERIALGQSVREICRDEEMPAMSTVFKWLSLHKGFAEQYARAKEAGAEAMAEELLEIADDGSNDWMERQNSDGSTYDVVNSEHISRSKLRVDTRKWLLAKLAPKKYGEKVQTEHTGPNGGAIVQRIERVIVDPKAE